MSSKRYHINPDTGVPSVCRAGSGKCPYGGDSGTENHYNTYSEAQKQSQEVFEQTYRLLPSSVEQNPSELRDLIEERRKVKEDTISNLPSADSGDYEITKAIINTNDENVVMGVVEGEIYEDTSWQYASVALQNPNVSKVLLNEALFDYPGEFDETTRRWLTLNRSLSHEELVSIIEDENEDMTARTVAFRNTNLSDEYVNNIINNDTDKLEKLPYSMIIWSDRTNEATEKVKNEAMLYSTRDNGEIVQARAMAVAFRPWANLYRDEIKEGK